jgi:hypothetical protein
MLVLLHNLDGAKQAFKEAALPDVFDGGSVPLEPDGGFTVELGLMVTGGFGCTVRATAWHRNRDARRQSL